MLLLTGEQLLVLHFAKNGIVGKLLAGESRNIYELTSRIQPFMMYESIFSLTSGKKRGGGQEEDSIRSKNLI